jgi:pilus assembly protein Flp/PilA
MKAFLSSLRQLLKSEDGPTAVEYAVMLSLIIAVCIAAITSIGNNASSVFSNVANSIK